MCSWLITPTHYIDKNMIKEIIYKVEDQDNADFGKTFKIKQPAVLEFEKLLVKFGGCFSSEGGLNEDKTNNLLTEILKYCYYINGETEIQLINERANDIIEDPITLIELKTKFILENKSFTKVVELIKQKLVLITTTMKK